MSNIAKQQNEGGAVARPIDQIKHLISSDAMQKQFRLALPSHIKVEMFTRNLMTALQENPGLADCNRDTLLKAAMTAAQLGLLVGSALGQAYILPFKNNGRLEATMIPGYRGYLTLARNSGEVESMQAFEVCERDEFDYKLGFNVDVTHKPAMGERGPIKFVYCAVTFKDGGRHLEVMTSAEVEAIRARSKSPNSPAWVKDWMMMARKTVIRRTAKYLPLSVQRLAAMENEHEFGASEAMNMGALGAPGTIDGSAQTVEHGKLERFETAGEDSTAGEDTTDTTGASADDEARSTAHSPDAPLSGQAQEEPQDQQPPTDPPLSDAGSAAGKDDDGQPSMFAGGEQLSSLERFIKVMDSLASTGAIDAEIRKHGAWYDTLDDEEKMHVDNAVDRARERARKREKKW